MPKKANEMKELKKKVDEFFSSTEKDKNLKQALDRRKKAVVKLNAASEVDPKILDVPVTV